MTSPSVNLPASSLKLLENPAALCNMVRRIAIEAGLITLKYFDDLEFDVEHKADGSPVTLADREAEIYIHKALADIMPGIPMIAEEAADAGTLPELGDSNYFWLVDPLDGTREFVTGGDEFTVNIALMHNKEPIMGVVYAPATGILYAGHGPGTAIRWNEETGRDKQISVRPLPKQGLTVVASKGHGHQGKMEEFLEQFKIEKIIKKGSSLKICAIAEGKADIYPRFGQTYEWDTAAGEAVLRAAGGVLTDAEGKALDYGGTNKNYLNPAFIACSFEWFDID